MLKLLSGPLECYVDGEKVEMQPGDFCGGWMTGEVEGRVKEGWALGGVEGGC